MFTVSKKVISSTTVFSIDNIKNYFLSRKLAYWNDFWGIIRQWRLE